MKWLRRLWNRCRIRAAITSNRRWCEREGKKERKRQSPLRELIGRVFVVDPSRIPDSARSVGFVACHLFPAAMRVEHGPYGPVPSEPPLAMACPECDFRQPAMQQAEARRCGYCGSNLQCHGTRVYVWNPTEPAEWTYQPRASNAE